eukprot:6213536-Pleurochrysis_carterae.AAC.3
MRRRVVAALLTLQAATPAWLFSVLSSATAKAMGIAFVDWNSGATFGTRMVHGIHALNPVMRMVMRVLARPISLKVDAELYARARLILDVGGWGERAGVGRGLHSIDS